MRTKLMLSVTADADAQPGTRPLIVVNEDCSMALVPNAIDVAASPTLANETPVLAPKGGAAVVRKKVTKVPVG